MAGPSAPEAHSEQLAQAVASLIWKDPERILDMMPDLRRAGMVIECRLRGGSMGKAIPAGSPIRIDLGPSARPLAGDIVAFLRGKDICVHRVTYLGRGRTARDFLVTQGDACFYPDAPVELSRIIGHVTEYRNGPEWMCVGGRAADERAYSRLGRTLLCAFALLVELNVALARIFAKVLRLRPESAKAVGAPARD